MSQMATNADWYIIFVLHKEHMHLKVKCNFGNHHENAIRYLFGKKLEKVPDCDKSFWSKFASETE